MPSSQKAVRLLMPLLLLLLFMFGCPFYELFGITCPCCGVTRAWLAFLCGDLVLAFQFHLFFPVVPVILLLVLLRNRIYLTKIVDVCLYVFAIVLFIYNGMRWVGLVNMPSHL